MRRVDARPAATVIVARPAPRGIEVLAVRRAAAAPFAPGFLVFPGGLIEPGDAALAARLFGDPAEAPRACALRELYEEAGLLLTAEGPEERDGRPALDSLRFPAPDPAALVEVSRWVAPEFLAVRFDARFFAVAAPRGLRPIPDGTEVDRAWWAAPADLLAARARGEAPLMWPTLSALRALAGCRTVEEALALRIEQAPPPPGWTASPASRLPEGLREER